MAWAFHLTINWESEWSSLSKRKISPPVVRSERWRRSDAIFHRRLQASSNAIRLDRAHHWTAGCRSWLAVGDATAEPGGICVRTVHSDVCSYLQSISFHIFHIRSEHTHTHTHARFTCRSRASEIRSRTENTISLGEASQIKSRQWRQMTCWWAVANALARERRRFCEVHTRATLTFGCVSTRRAKPRFAVSLNAAADYSQAPILECKLATTRVVCLRRAFDKASRGFRQETPTIVTTN